MGNSNKSQAKEHAWLLFFYSVPPKPVNARMKIWRRLAKAGAVQLKSSVYILPYSAEHYEFLQWLASEVASLKGEGTYITAKKIEPLTNAEVADIFNRQRVIEYKNIQKALEDIERKINSMKKGAGQKNIKELRTRLNKCLNAYEEINGIDFFSTKSGTELKSRIKAAESEFMAVSGMKVGAGSDRVVMRHAGDYQWKIWVTRPKPFVDRMASAWLIKNFIDKKAAFKFIDEKDMKTQGEDMVVFDMRGGEFTHSGDMCTFEMLVRTFGIKDKTVKKIAELVHELDMKDGKYNVPEAKGIEDILSGIRKTGGKDADILEKGIAVFEMLHASKN